MKLFSLTCDEATTICDKSQYGESTLWEKIKLNIHFTKCKVCRLYTKQNNLISRIINGNKETLCGKENTCLSRQEKDRLKKEMENFIS